MRSKSVALLLVFSLSLIPAAPGHAATQIQHSLEDALFLMYASDVILSGESETEDLAGIGLPSAPILQGPNPDLSDATMAAILQALKNMRNELDTNCRILTRRLRSEGKNCEADRIQETCNQKRNEINTEIGAYHDLRGDKRKAPTRFWHFLKRNGRTIWHKIGPVGRTFMRRLGPEVLQAVASGGLSSGVLKKLLKNVARSIGRDRIKEAVFQGVERMLQGQLDILTAAGVDICDPDAEVAAEEENPSSSTGDGTGPIPDGAKWECADVAGPVAALLASRPTMEGVETNYYKFDHWLIYNEDPPALHYFYSYDNSETWDEGTLGMITHTWSGEFEDTSVAVDEYGVFRVHLEWNEYRAASSYYASSQVPLIHNQWGLIPAENYQTVYLCDWGPREMPTGLETLSPENFRDRCGPSAYYFECFLK